MSLQSPHTRLVLFLVMLSLVGLVIAEALEARWSLRQVLRRLWQRLDALPVGTKSLLFGVHSFWLHPWFVAAAWTVVYGFPWHPLYWLAFLVHDWGYWGSPNMDGTEGERHVELGARIMGIFGKKWRDFALYHSRFYAKNEGADYSRLCVADKLSFCMTPRWLYLLLARASGELAEYKALADKRAAAGERQFTPPGFYRNDDEIWYERVNLFIRNWVAEHRDGKQDTWTPAMRTAAPTAESQQFADLPLITAEAGARISSYIVTCSCGKTSLLYLVPCRVESLTGGPATQMDAAIPSVLGWCLATKYDVPDKAAAPGWNCGLPGHYQVDMKPINE